ncbi:Hsp20/alpha crystallin family protein [Candidatus Sulfidibacterium hydrothermale]|uniref:Hsp20/alpha crystallin family protein n=1 Tax=Candidatus Sulfidibacterium hydrothermale TaxID=2875962 RepID=UPI001F0ABA41|nr:Hsp20/alpha crystallin family protein [Candidatus Sulfidibacterium hydrothermale]UBM62137.1 Hsp20/alpha crystallin family protein [Candidatus Sulfidibacterium hydrothermale]
MSLVKFNQYPTFTDLLENIERNFLGRVDEYTGDVPAVNIKEEKDKFVLEMAAPGMKKDDFQINLDNYQLTISSEKKEEKNEKDDNYTRREFFYSTFSRSFTLPKSVDVEKIKADYKNGILSVVLPKKEEETKLTRQIKIS